VQQKNTARRALGLFNLRKFPARARFVRRWVEQRLRQRALHNDSSLAADLATLRIDLSEWIVERRHNPRLHVSAARAALPGYLARYPDRAATCVADAERILAHEFDLLGSGPFRSRCPRRSSRSDGYQPIDWMLDPVRGLRFPEGFSYSEWDLYRDRPGNADVKYPWELARCQHFLAQAWCATGNSRYAAEILAEIWDFDEANPIGRGINWTCTMDVALRAANWAIALDLIGPCDELDEAELTSAYERLFDHGRFIRANLENVYEVTSNHYLSNVVGLQFVGAALGESPTARNWLAFAERAVEKEIDVQVLPDGADFESSIPYHRLVAELFLGSFRLAQYMQRPFASPFSRRLEQMIDYLVAVLPPNGEMPTLGDADDGRLMIATDYGRWNRKDPRHLLAPAAMTLGVPEWLRVAPQHAGWEAIWWGFDGSTISCEDSPPPDRAELFPFAGVALSRTHVGGGYLMASNSIVGTRGFGNHKNNDQLSFEYHDRCQPLIVDPGSYVYTSDFEARNLFRSTAYHNTVQIDGVEQNEINPAWLFRMFEKAQPEHVSFVDSDGITVYVGVHHGYETQLSNPVRHQRTFRHDRNVSRLEVADVLAGSGVHDVRWHFHFHPTVTPEFTGDRIVHLHTARGDWRLSWSGEYSARSIESTWYSPSYGVRVPTRALRLLANGVVIGRNEWAFTIERTASSASGNPP